MNDRLFHFFLSHGCVSIDNYSKKDIKVIEVQIMNTFSVRSLTAAVLLSVSTMLCASTTFNDVERVVFGPMPPAQDDEQAQEQSIYQQSLLPQYRVTISNFFEDGINLLWQVSDDLTQTYFAHGARELAMARTEATSLVKGTV